MKPDRCDCGAAIRFVVVDGVSLPVEAQPEPYWAPIVGPAAILFTPGSSPRLIQQAGADHVYLSIRVPHWPTCRFRDKWISKGAPEIPI